MHFLIRTITEFWPTFIGSSFSFRFYRKIVKQRFSFSLKFFLLFSFSLGVVLTALSAVMIEPILTQFVKRFETRSSALYPQDLVITIENGQLHTNTTEPVHFAIPFELFVDTPGAIPDQQQQFLLTIDPKKTPADYAESNSIVLVTAKEIVVENEIYALEDIKQATIDKTTIDQILAELMPFVRWLPGAIILLLWGVFTLLLPFIRLLSLGILGIFVYLAAQFLHVPLSYGKTFQIGLHSLTLPTLIQIVMLALDLHPPIPLFFGLLFFLYNLVILSELKKAPEK